MAALLEVGVVNGVPNQGTGEAATINALMAMVASQTTLAAILAKVGGTTVPGTATIVNGASLSAAVDLGTGRLIQIQMPTAWTAASITFQTSTNGVTYADLYDFTGSEYQVFAEANRSIVIPRDDFIGTRFLKVRSGTADVPVIQGGSRDLALVLI